MATRVSGTKRSFSECHMIAPDQQPRISASANGPVVYVRRKTEGDAVRSSINDNASILADGQVAMKLNTQEARTDPISQTKEMTVQSATGDGKINADGQVVRKVSNQEARAKLISQPKELTIQSSNDDLNIDIDFQVSKKLSNQEASTGPISQTEEPTVQSSNDKGNTIADLELLRINMHQETGTGHMSQTKKPEVLGTNDNENNNAEASKKVIHQEGGTRQISQTKEPKGHFANNNANMKADRQVSRVTSHQDTSTRLVSHSTKATTHGIPVLRPFPAGSNCQHLGSATPSSGSSKGLRNLHWEERSHQLQLLLKKLNQAGHDYYNILWSLSAVELSRHAVELEKRSIQLSLEEAKELKRVGILNVLGKPMSPF